MRTAALVSTMQSETHAAFNHSPSEDKKTRSKSLCFHVVRVFSGSTESTVVVIFAFHVSCPQNTQNGRRLAGTDFALVAPCASADVGCIAFSNFISACCAGTFNFKRDAVAIHLLQQFIDANPASIGIGLASRLSGSGVLAP